MEMSKQMLVIKQSLGHLLRQQRQIQLYNASTHESYSSRGNAYSTSLVAPPSGGGGDLIDPAYSNIMFALNAASGSLVSMANNLIDPRHIATGHQCLPSESETSLCETFPLIDENLRGPAARDVSQLSKKTPRHRSPLSDLEPPPLSNYLNGDPALHASSQVVAVRSCSVQSNDLDDISVDNALLNAAASARDVRLAAFRFGVIS